jgi:hypothetical protein
LSVRLVAGRGGDPDCAFPAQIEAAHRCPPRRIAREEGMSDYNCVDVIREAQATIVAAAQSSTSLIPQLGREKVRVFTLNLRNRLIFKAADEEGAAESADFLEKKRLWHNFSRIKETAVWLD